MRAWVLVPVVLYLCFMSQLDSVGLLGPDEPRYAAIAREMVESGDWVTPRLDGKPWFEKPVLYYWAAAVAFRWFGVSETTARLPSSAAAVLVLLALAWAAAKFYGRDAAWFVCLIWPTTVAAIGLSRAATTDMLFTACLSAAMVTAAGMLFRSQQNSQTGTDSGLLHRRNLGAQLCWGAFLGAATMAKGPVGVALAAGCVGAWTVTARRWKDAFGLCRPASVLAFAIVALPWYVICAARNPEFAGTFLFIHNIERYLTPRFLHEQPFWYFVPILLLGLAPWTGLLLGAIQNEAHAWRWKEWRSSPGVFLVCWIAFPLAFFSFSKSKLPGYILPVIPPLTLLVAGSLSRQFGERRVEGDIDRANGKWKAVLLGITLLALASSTGYWATRLPDDVRIDVKFWTEVVGGATAAGGVIILGWASLRPRSAVAFAVGLTAMLVAGLLEMTNRMVMPQLDAPLSARQAASALSHARDPAEAVFVFHVHRAWQYGLNFYLHRELSEWSAAQATPALVFTSDAGLAEVARMGRAHSVLARCNTHVSLIRIGPVTR